MTTSPVRAAVFVKAAINGALTKADHVAAPVTAKEIADAALAVEAAGADAVHLHPRSADARQSIEPDAVAEALEAVRAAGLRAPAGVTTGLWCCGGDPDRRLELVRAWHVHPDFASVAFGEEGAEDAAFALVAADIELESAVWSTDEVPLLLASRFLHENIRVLIEPVDEDATAAVEHAREMAARLVAGGVRCPLLYHGDGSTVWPVLRAALADGCQLRIGLEDGVQLPDGSIAPDNEALVRAARLEAGVHLSGAVG